MVVRSGTGTSDIAGVFHGDNEIDAIYHGTTNVYQSTPPRLYLLNTTNDRLEIADENLRSSSRVGRTTRFGTNERDPRGLASYGGNLYMIGDDQLGIYTLDTSTGRATRIGTGAHGSGSSGFFSHGDELIEIASNGVAERFNPTTGARNGAIQLGGGDSGILDGISHGGSVYFVSSGFLFITDTMNLKTFAINIITVGSLNVGIVRSISSDGRNMYVLSDNHDLYRIDLVSSGSGTTIRSTRVTPNSGFPARSYRAIAFHRG